jgi:hypothetical protein
MQIEDPDTELIMNIGFAIITSDFEYVQDCITEDVEYNREDKDMDTLINAGLITDSGEVTQLGWDTLNEDSMKIERNVLNYLKETFVFASDEGHDSGGDLIGSLDINVNDSKQLEAIDGEFISENSRIIHSDNFTNEESIKFINGISDFGKMYLEVEIEYFDIPPELEEKL